jgi:hypothetical protein
MEGELNLTTLLLDLDNTLVQYKIDSDDFEETAFDLFFQHLAQWAPFEKTIPAIKRAWEKMDSNQGSSLTRSLSQCQVGKVFSNGRSITVWLWRL